MFKTRLFNQTCMLCGLYPVTASPHRPAHRNNARSTDSVESSPRFTSICPQCVSDLPLTGHLCPTGSATASPDAAIHASSSQQVQDTHQHSKHVFTQAVPEILAASDYAFPITQLISAYKYAGRLELLPILVDCYLTLPKPHHRSLIVPMPSSPSRLKSRGFDHIHLISKRLSNAWGIPLWQGVKRIGDAPRQQGLSRHERLKNIQGQFILSRQPPVGHRLLIIDDVCTTGSTIAALSACLRPTKLHCHAYVLAHKLNG